MALKIWLPFINDVNNYGLAININNYSLNNFTSDSNGKIGKCYSGLGIYHLSEDILDNTWSLALWVKATAWGVNNDILLCKNNNESTSCQFYMSVINGKTFNIGINGGSSTGQYSYTFSTNTWYHLATTYNGSTYKLYLNGNEVKSASTTAAKINGLLNIGIGCRSTNVGGTTQTGYTSTKYYNDVRIYDHCLSPKEVKEISKGLVLHYPLNNGGFGQENLATNTAFPNSNVQGYCGQKAILYNHSDWTSGGRFFVGDSNSHLTFTEIQANQPYTISAWVYIYDDVVVSHPGGTSIFYRVYKTGTSPTYSYDIAVTLNNITERNKWIKISNTFISPYTYTYNQGGFFSIGGYNGHFLVSMPKVELGSIATPWCPNSSDALADKLGLNNGIEYDVSGYQNNGTITGTLNYSSDTPKYSVSTAFDGTQKIVTSSFTSEIKTMSAWVKTTKNKNTSQLVCADSASKLCISFYSGCIISYFASSGHSTGSRCTLGSSYIENGWNHIVVISTGSGTRDVYCNGVKLTPTNNDYWSPAAGFLIGSRNTSSAPIPFYGSISDVRVYTTALSVDDVLELYHTPASITNNGTLMTQGEISEV